MSLQKIYLFFILLLASFLIFAQSPLNLSLEKQALVKYYDSGEYIQEINKNINDAKQYLQTRLQQNSEHKKLAIVLDIDDTSISGYRFMKAEDFGAATPNYLNNLWCNDHDPIIPVRNLYQFAKQNGVATFFVTARPKRLLRVTAENLRLAGYNDWNGLIPVGNVKQLKPTMAVYKAKVRKQLTQEGYDIVLNIGDQESDLAGGYAERSVKLPNPFYIVP